MSNGKYDYKWTNRVMVVSAICAAILLIMVMGRMNQEAMTACKNTNIGNDVCEFNIH